MNFPQTVRRLAAPAVTALLALVFGLQAGEPDALTRLGQNLSDSALLRSDGRATPARKVVYTSGAASSLADGLGFASSGDVRERNQQTLASIRDQQTRLADQRVALADRKSSFDDMRARLNEQRLRVADLQNAMRQRMQDQQWKLADMRTRTSDQQWRLADMRTRMQDQQWKLTDMRSRMNDQQWKLADMRTRMMDQQWKMADMRSRMQDQQWKLADMRSRMMDQQWKLADMRSRMMDQQWKLADVRTRMTDQGWGMANMQNRLTDQFSRNYQMQSNFRQTVQEQQWRMAYFRSRVDDYQIRAQPGLQALGSATQLHWKLATEMPYRFSSHSFVDPYWPPRTAAETRAAFKDFLDRTEWTLQMGRGFPRIATVAIASADVFLTAHGAMEAANLNLDYIRQGFRQSNPQMPSGRYQYSVLNGQIDRSTFRFTPITR